VRSKTEPSLRQEETRQKRDGQVEARKGPEGFQGGELDLAEKTRRRATKREFSAE
jgi:hypothetical protein